MSASGTPLPWDRDNGPCVMAPPHLRDWAEEAAAFLSRRGMDGVTAFATSHDAAQSMDYRIDGSGSVGILTDTGYVTPEAEETLPGVGLLVLESNHDVEWLRSGPYPYSLKARILGDEGHLSNDAAAEFAARMARCGTRCIILAHLSRENNTPQRAWDTVQRRLNTVEAEVLLEVAPRSEVSLPYGTEVPVCSE